MLQQFRRDFAARNQVGHADKRHVDERAKQKPVELRGFVNDDERRADDGCFKRRRAARYDRQRGCSDGIVSVVFNDAHICSTAACGNGPLSFGVGDGRRERQDELNVRTR